MISNNYIKIEKIEEENKNGFQTVETQDSFVYKGRVIELPKESVDIGGHTLKIGDCIMFAKYSPDTHEVIQNNKPIKFVKITDILEVYESN